LSWSRSALLLYWSVSSLSPFPSPFLFPLIIINYVITGEITSNSLSNLPTTKIKLSSIYAPGKEAIEALMDGRAVKGNHTSAEKYAETVVKNVMRRNPKNRIWVGCVVGAIWFVSKSYVFVGYCLGLDFGEAGGDWGVEKGFEEKSI
jgi:hypothetical protein